MLFSVCLPTCRETDTNDLHQFFEAFGLKKLMFGVFFPRQVGGKTPNHDYIDRHYLKLGQLHVKPPIHVPFNFLPKNEKHN